MDSGILLGLVGLGSLLVGFISGLAAYAHLYQHFISREEGKRQRAVAVAKQEVARKMMERKDMVERVRERFVQEGAPEEVVSEEIERVLGTGPR